MHLNVAEESFFTNGALPPAAKARQELNSLVVEATDMSPTESGEWRLVKLAVQGQVQGGCGAASMLAYFKRSRTCPSFSLRQAQLR